MMAEQTKTQAEVWVVFTGKTDMRWLKILKPGFRHCYALLNDGQRWMSIDPLSSYTDIQIHHHIAPEFDLPNWLEDQGFKVVKANINNTHERAAPWVVLTCVESIKRILGLHKRRLITPWQLYNFLKHKQSSSPLLKGENQWAV